MRARDIQSSIIAENTSQSGLSDLDVASATSVTGANNLITPKRSVQRPVER